jgi:hypothetical protein
MLGRELRLHALIRSGCRPAGLKSNHLQVGVVSFAGAGSAHCAAALQHFALEINAFAAFGTDYPGTFEARKVLGPDFDLHPFFVKQYFVGQLRVRFLLAAVFGHFREHFAGGLLAGFFGGDTDGAASLQVNEGGGHFSPVAEFQGALAEPAICDERDGVGDAPVDLDVRDDAFALGDGVVDAEFAQAQHRETYAQDLPGTEMAVGHRGEVEVFG